MNESTNLISVMYLVASQLQNMKEKLDPEVYELLNKSGHEAIASAHHFLDACEKALDSFIDAQENEKPSEVETTNDNIVEFNTRES